MIDSYDHKENSLSSPVKSCLLACVLSSVLMALGSLPMSVRL